MLSDAFQRHLNERRQPVEGHAVRGEVLMTRDVRSHFVLISGVPETINKFPVYGEVADDIGCNRRVLEQIQQLCCLG